MTPELLGGAILSAVGLLIIVGFALRQLESAKQRRSHLATRAAWQLRRITKALDHIPGAFLTAPIKRSLARMIQMGIATIIKHDPKFKGLTEFQGKTQQFLSSIESEAPTQHPLLSPADRKECVNSLRDVRKLMNEARRQGTISEKDCHQNQAVIDTMLVRLVVDHLKQNAFNAEAAARYEDALRYMQKAIESLGMVNERNRHREEMSALNNDMMRVRELHRAELEQRRASSNNLLKAMQVEGSKQEVEAPRLITDP